MNSKIIENCDFNKSRLRLLFPEAIFTDNQGHSNE